MSAQKSRLDRLLGLLDSGSAAVRSVAAKQIGEVTKYHQDEQPFVLAKVSTLLRSKCWETRVAAGEAISAIAQFVPTYEQVHNSTTTTVVTTVVKKEEGEELNDTTSTKDQQQQQQSVDDHLSFTNFDIANVLAFGTQLLAANVGDDDPAESDALEKMNQMERLTYNKQKLRSLLGLNGPATVDPSRVTQISQQHASLDDVDDEILFSPTSSMNVDQIIEDATDLMNMTASERRQYNKKKRDAKKQKKKPSKTQQSNNGERTTKRQKTESDSTSSSTGVDDDDDDELDESIPLKDDRRWAFHWLTERLRTDLFNPKWEIRHGAAIGLREIMKNHAASAGKSESCHTAQELYLANQACLEDICICILCMFVLDQFSDFVSDQVIAPVRETCAQILAIILQHISTPTVKSIVQCLITLVKCDKWQVRHGGLLGLKYTIAIRLSDIDELLPIVLPAVISAIDDMSDDVRSVAADTLVPVAEHVVRLAPNELEFIHDKLWDILLDLDDLSSATASVMTLLAKFYAIAGHDPNSALFFSKNLSKLVPRLWPFLRHNLPTVRRSAIDTLHKLVSGSKDCGVWLVSILGETMCYLFQNLILETKPDIIRTSHSVWDLILQRISGDIMINVVNGLLGNWVTLLSTPLSTKMDLNLMVLPASVKSALQYVAPKPQPPPPKQVGQKGKRKKKDASVAPSPVVFAQEEHKTFAVRLAIENAEEMTLMRMQGSRALSRLISYYSQNQDLTAFFSTLQHLLDSEWAVHKQVGSFLIQELYLSGINTVVLPKYIQERLLGIVAGQQFSYSEMQQVYSGLLADTHSLLEFYAAANFDVSTYYSHDAATNSTSINNLSLEDASDVATRIFDFCVANITDVNARSELEVRRNRVLGSVERYTSTSVNLHTETMACISSAIVHSNILPPVIDQIVHSLMESVAKEAASTTLQERSALSLATLIHLCVTRDPCPNHHIVSSLCGLLCSNMPPTTLKPENDANTKKTKKTPKKKGMQVDEPEVKSKEQIAHRGAVLSLRFLGERFGAHLFDALPILWSFTGQILCQPVPNIVPDSPITPELQHIINALHVVTVIGPSVNKTLHPILVRLLDAMLLLVSIPQEQVRAFLALSIASMCSVITNDAMRLIIDKLLPMLADPKNASSRRGAVSVLYKIITTLDMDILPYIVFFVVPLLKRMSDQDPTTRELASNCFGMVINILPLEKSAKTAPGFEEAREKERKFIDQLLDNSKVEPFELPIHINAELRQYQKDGISWMAFLNKYNLHGILCDDMGLGKTLQTICMVASDIITRRRLYEQTKSIEHIHLPSLVVCPPTLVGHWHFEIQKFCPDLKAVQYTGNVHQRKTIRDEMSTYDIVILSYDILRNDIDRISEAQNCWNYCVLDEGHIIKNKKTQVTKAVKMVNANHRLILSGTPIQNNVLELWSLFDFLMPGFLGTEKEFNIRYSKPIAASKDAKANSKEQAEGTLAMEALHRQVLPFLLRRVKEDVLHDLPEKIVQDYYCDLSPLQSRLYEDFSKSHMRDEIADTLNHMAKEGPQSIDQEDGKQHVFQALQYLRKLCNHPCLVLNENHPQYNDISNELQQQGKSIRDVSLSPKLLALKQLLLDCGIGMSVTANEDIDFMSQHRVLIFCQLKSVLDLIEHDLFKNQMPSVSYMRLDGSVEPSKRYGIVHKFNSDPTIDVLLLTTHVGGLGLNLTGADTVIFVEHDWNPSADLQAMDRAHRIGQKKVVNVYRIITRNTLEEKIMGLQQFKLNISKAVVNTENSDTRTMNTDQLVDLFQLSDGQKTSISNNTGAISLSDPNSDLWEEKQYEEFDLTSFLQKLK